MNTPQDIEEIDKRIASFTQNDKKTKDVSTQTISQGFRLGTEFIAAVISGICLGMLFDNIFGTKVLFLLVFSLFGCIAGILNVYRSAQKIDACIQEEND